MPPHGLSEAVNVFLELPPQPGLSDPSRPRDQHHPGHPAFRRGMEQLPDRAQLRVPAHQRRLQAINPLDAAHPGQHPVGAPQLGRLGLALQLVAARVGERDPAAREALRRPVHEHLPRFRRRLHPGRGVHRVPGDHPLADCANGHRDLTGDDPGPGSQAVHAGLLPQLAHRGHQIQGRTHGPLGVPLGGHWRPPYRHHRVADELLHHPPVAADHRPRHPEIRGQQLADQLRIPRLGQRGESHQIAKQHRAHPALRHRCFGARRGGPYRPRGRERYCRWHRGSCDRHSVREREAAGAAESLTRSERLTARRAAHQRSAAIPAEPVAPRSRRPALGARRHHAIVFPGRNSGRENSRMTRPTAVGFWGERLSLVRPRKSGRREVLL